MPDPEPGPAEALIAVRASGICHADIDLLHARYGPGAFLVDATIYGAPFGIFCCHLTLAGTHSLNHNIPETLAAIRAYGHRDGWPAGHGDCPQGHCQGSHGVQVTAA